MNVVAIVCCDPNGVIGFEGKLPWDWPEQLQYFREATMGCPVIFGHKTMRSIGKPLPGRVPIVVSHGKPDMPEGWVWQRSPKDALAYARNACEEFNLRRNTVFVGGGEAIYRQLLGHCNVISLTQISKAYMGDTFFPLKDVTESNWAREGSMVVPVPPTVAKAGYNVVYRRRGDADQ